MTELQLLGAIGLGAIALSLVVAWAVSSNRKIVRLVRVERVLVRRAQGRGWRERAMHRTRGY